MPIETPSNQPAEWLSLPVIATIARLLCRELTLQNEYLRLENKILKSRLPGRIRFTDDERRSLVDAALAMGRKLMETVVNIVSYLSHRSLQDFAIHVNLLRKFLP